MRDKDKTRIQLLDDVKELQQQIADFDQIKNEYQEAIDKLKDSEKQYRIIADNAHDWEFWLNADERLIYTSPSCKRITGYDPEDFKKNQNLLFRIIHPDDRSIFDEHCRMAHKIKSPEEEFRIIRKNGETRWISNVCQPVYDENGRYSGIRASNRDVTDYKKAEDDRIESEKHLRLIVENMNDVIWTMDTNLYLTYISPSVEQLCGYTTDEAMAQTLEEVLTPASFKLATEIWEKEMALEYSGKANLNCFRTISLECLCKDGSTVWAESRITPIRDVKGRLIEILGISRDITERRSAEEKLLENEKQLRRSENQLRESENRLREAENRLREGENRLREGENRLLEDQNRLRVLLNAFTETIYLIDVEGNVLFANETTARRLGTNLETLLKKRNIYNFIPSEIAVKQRQRVFESQKTGKPIHFEDEQFGRTILNSINPILGKDGKVTQLAVFGTDITERKQAKEKLLESEKQLQQGETRLYESEKQLRQSENQLRENEKQLRQSENQLQESGNRLRAFLDASTESILLLDIEGNVLFANETAALSLGTDLETLLKKRNMYAFIPPEIAEKHRQSILEIQKTGKPIRFEDERLGRSMLTSINPVLGKDGKVTQLAILGTDITDCKASEAALDQNRQKLAETNLMLQQAIDAIPPLAETNRMFQRVLDAIPLRIFWKDKNSIYLGCNQLFARDAGRKSPEEIIGKNDLNMGWRDQADHYRQDDLEVMNTGKPKINYEETRNTPDEKHVSFKTSKVPLMDMDNNIIGVLVAYDNIMEHKITEDTLRGSEEHYRSLFENNHAIMLLVDPDSHAIIDANRVACAYYGWSREELTKKKISEINMLTGEEIKTQMDRARKQKRNHFIAKHRRADGSVRDVEVFNGPIKMHDKSLLYSMVCDITERKKMENALSHAAKLESLGILAGGIAHDFNNLMMIVQGNIDMAILGIPDDHIAQQRLKSAQEMLEKTRALTGQLITFSQGGQPRVKVCHVENILRDAVKSTLKSSSVIPSIEIQKGLWPVEIDEGQITQCFCSLAENAREAMPGGGELKICAENIEVKEADALPLADGPYLRIVFEDNGIGIAKEHIDKIFDPYFTTKAKGQDKGMGLGLTVCYSVLKKHGGYIAVDSPKGNGTVFSLYLPVKPDLALQRNSKEEKVFVSSHMRVLIMDDNPDIRELLQLYTEQLDLEATAVADGQEAVNEYKKALDAGNAYSAVILALSVRQGLGGDAALVRLKKIAPDIKAIVMSGYDDPIMKKYADHGFQGALRKPFRFDDMKKVLEEILT